MLTRAPGTSIKSPPIEIHPAWFEEKSGAAAFCSAIAGALGIAHNRPARMPRAPPLTVNEYIAIPPRVLFLLQSIASANLKGLEYRPQGRPFWSPGSRTAPLTGWVKTVHYVGRELGDHKGRPHW